MVDRIRVLFQKDPNSSMTFRIARFFAPIVLLTLSALAQTVPSVQEVAAKWRAAIGEGHSKAPTTAVLTCSSMEDGIPGNMVERIGLVRVVRFTAGQSDARTHLEYRRSAKREFDGADLVLAETINQRRDWNGFVREMRGKELERLRTMASERQVLVFGPPPSVYVLRPGAAVPPPSVSLSEDRKFYLLRFALPGMKPITWWIDLQTGL